MTTRRAFALGGAAALATGLWGSGAEAQAPDILAGARREARINLATSAPGDGFPRFLQAFREKYPFVDVSSGFYTAPTGRALARVLAEVQARNVSVDLVHVASMAPYLDMTQRGQLMAYRSPEAATYPAMAVDRDGHWATARAIGVIMAYNRNTLPEARAPRSWADLLKPEFKGRKIAIQNAASGTAFNQFYLLEKLLGVQFLRRLAAQEPVVMATSGQVDDALIRGEVLVGATVDHWRAFAADSMRAGIVAVYPEEGMPVALAPIGIIRGAPNSNTARLFMDYLLSNEGQTKLNTEIYGVYSMRPDVAPPPGQRPLAQTKPLLPTDMADYARAAARFPEHFDAIFRA